jgi:hypothetical protein
MKRHNPFTPEEIEENRRVLARVHQALHCEPGTIIEYGWYYLTSDGKRVEHISTDPIEDEDEVRKAIAASLLVGDKEKRVTD